MSLSNSSRKYTGPAGGSVGTGSGVGTSLVAVAGGLVGEGSAVGMVWGVFVGAINWALVGLGLGTGVSVGEPPILQASVTRIIISIGNINLLFIIYLFIDMIKIYYWPGLFKVNTKIFELRNDRYRFAVRV